VSAEDDHLTEELLLQFLHGQIPTQRFLERMYRHLRAKCDDCREEHALMWIAVRDKGLFETWILGTLAKYQILNGDMEQVRHVAERELAELMKLHPEERRLVVCQHPAKLRNPYLVTMLLDKSKEERANHPREALDFAQLALDVAVRVDHRVYGSPFVFDLLAQALGHKGNALRILGELATAESVITCALKIFEDDRADDFLTKAELLSFAASLRRDQRRFDEAEDLVLQTVETYREIGDTPGVARSLIQASGIAHERGEVVQAIAEIRSALSHLDPERTPDLYYYARFDEALYLADDGEYLAARRSLEEHRAGIEALPEHCFHIQLVWLDGRIAHGLGDVEAAERHYTVARTSYQAERLPYDAAMVSLDLAILYAEEGKTAAVRELAEEMLPVFQAREVHREATAALMLFHDAAQTDRVSTEMLRGLVTYLERLRRDPLLRGKR
jgi:tetratricopeptide (TPR) repeat protein